MSKLLCATYYLTAVVAVSKLWADSPAELVALVARVSKLLCATYYLTAVVAVSKL